MGIGLRSTLIVLSISLFNVFTVSGFAENIPFTILHTNDLHSRFRPSKGEPHLGGVARLATQIKQIRKSTPNTLLLDGGDWSEGGVYYKLHSDENTDVGQASIQILNALGYDATVLGNHDWLNGPDHVLKLLNANQPKFKVLGANIDFSGYPQATDLQKWIKPYEIFQVGKLRVGIIGLVTFELIYDKFLKPVNPLWPTPFADDLSRKLKTDPDPAKRVDVVIVISHNQRLIFNQPIARMPYVDIVIHAHDHYKYNQPLAWDASGKQAPLLSASKFLVEAEKWGFYLGRLDLNYDTATKKLSASNYGLIQMDERIPEDKEVAVMITKYDEQLQSIYTNILDDHIADLEIDVRKGSRESLFGNLLANAYLEKFEGSDFSFENLSLTSDELYRGPVNSFDLFQSLSAVFDPFLKRTWTLKTGTMTGETLLKFLNSFLTAQGFTSIGLLSTSGIYALYDPLSAPGTKSDLLQKAHIGRGVLLDLKVNDTPLDLKRKYKFVISQGVLEIVEFISKRFSASVEFEEIKDSGVENWVALKEYLKKHSPITSEKISRGGRITVVQEDLGLYHDQFFSKRDDLKINVEIKVTNFGNTTSLNRNLQFMYDQTPDYYGDDPNPGKTQFWVVPIAPLEPGKSVVLKATMEFPKEFKNKKIPVYAYLQQAKEDSNPSNNATWVMSAP